MYTLEQTPVNRCNASPHWDGGACARVLLLSCFFFAPFRVGGKGGGLLTKIEAHVTFGGGGWWVGQSGHASPVAYIKCVVIASDRWPFFFGRGGGRGHFCTRRVPTVDSCLYTRPSVWPSRFLAREFFAFFLAGRRALWRGERRPRRAKSQLSRLPRLPPPPGSAPGNINLFSGGVRSAADSRR